MTCFNHFIPGVERRVLSSSHLLAIPKRLYFIFAALFFSVSMVAQVEPPTNSYLGGFQPKTADCESANFSSVVPLKINGDYRLYATTEEENRFFPEDIWVEDSDGATYEVTFDEKNGAYTSEKLPQGKAVILKYFDGCLNVVEDKSAVTEYTLGQILQVSNKLFSLVVDINALEKRSYDDILSSILSNSTVDDLEKLSFIQQYLLKGGSLNSTELKGIDQHSGYQKLKDDCNCTVVSTYFTNTPGTHLQMEQDDPGSRIITTDQSVDMVNELEFNLRSSGPAKLWHLYSDGWKRTRDTWWGGAIGAQVGRDDRGFPSVDPIQDIYLNDGLSLPAEFVQNTSIRMILTCNNGVQTEECGCAKQIQPLAMYESEIGVRTQVLDGGGGTKRAMAYGEDAAILYRQVMTGPNAGEFELMGADLFQMSSSCNSDVNPDFFSSILSVIEDVALIAVSFADTTSNPIDNIGNQISELLGSVDTLTNTPRRIVSGDCGFEANSRRYEFTPEPFFLRPSEIVQFALASRSRGLSMGMRSWQSEVLIKSDFRLALFQPRGTQTIRTDDEEERVQCCTERASVSWIYGLIEQQSDVPTVNMGLGSEPISSHFDMRASLGDALQVQISENGLLPFINGRFVVPSQWGSIVGKRTAKEGCQVIVYDDGPGGIYGPIDLLGRGTASDDEGRFNKNDESYNCQHTVYSIDGKKIGTVAAKLIIDEFGEKSLNTSLINEWLQNSSLPSGVYLVSTVNERGGMIVPTQKVIVTR
jgi:hypothetical protein